MTGTLALLRPGRLGLRARVTLAFGLMALALSVFLAGVTWVLVTRYLVHQRETSAAVEFADNAAALQDGLQAGLPVRKLLGSLPQSNKDASFLALHHHWYSTLPPQTGSSLSSTIVDAVSGGSDGSDSERRVTYDDRPYLALGTSVHDPSGRYYELFSMDDVDRTFTVLGVALVGGALATALLGLAVGRFASRQALRPLTAVREAAAAVAEGDLTARIDAEFDPDLGGLARSFNHTTEALQRRVRADARFAGDVSHELRTPMTTMLNSVQLIQNRRAALPPEVVEPLDLLTVELDRFRRLVVDLLEISRVDGGDEHPKEPVTAADLVRQAADRAAGRAVTTVSPGASCVVILADKRRLERVVANLVENAESHGGGCVGVQVESTEDDVTISVEDAGPGVPADRRDRVFDRFARDSTHGQGVGLGLAIVARHVTWHGGRVRVEDRDGGGSRFVVALPIRGT
jgi:signal transduction histidine kinase